jgi:hypothetical protein
MRCLRFAQSFVIVKYNEIHLFFSSALFEIRTAGNTRDVWMSYLPLMITHSYNLICGKKITYRVRTIIVKYNEIHLQCHLCHRWINNYLCNQCLSPLKLWVPIPLMARCTRYHMMWQIVVNSFVWPYNNNYRLTWVWIAHMFIHTISMYWLKALPSNLIYDVMQK